MSDAVPTDGALNPEQARMRWTVLIAILTGLTVLKALFNPFPFSDVKSDDGAYYYQVARNVAAGNGLETSVSIYHQGLSLPHAITYYPVWPLVLGASGSVIDLEAAASVLPEILYIVSLVLLFLLAERIARTLGADARPLVLAGVPLTAGHAAVLLFGLNDNFFRFTSLPFTEGLAFSLTFGVLLLATRDVDRAGGAMVAVLTGLLCGLAFLTRSQCIGLAVALPAAWLLIARSRRQSIRWALLASASAWGVIVAWGVHVFGIVEYPTVRMLIDNTAGREQLALPPYSAFPVSSTLWAQLGIYLQGLFVAFDFRNFFSYVRSFGPTVYLVPLAVLTVVGGRGVGRAWRRSADPNVIPVTATVLAGLLLLGPVHLKHSVRFGEWVFQFRDGLPMILLIVVALPYLLTRGPVLRAGVGLALAVSVAWNGTQIRRILAESYPPPTTAARELAVWVAAQTDTLVLLSTRPSTLAASTGGRFHEATCADPASLRQVYFEKLDVTHVVTFAVDEECPFFRNLSADLETIATFGPEGPRRMRLWALRGRPGPA